MKAISSYIVLLFFAGFFISTSCDHLPDNNILSSIKDDEVVIFFPTIGYPTANGEWELQIHGWIYEPQWEGTTFARRLLGLEEIAEDEEDSLLSKRAKAFFVDNERGKRIAVYLGKKRWILNNRSAKNGHFSDRLHLSHTEVEELRQQDATSSFIPFKAIAQDLRQFDGKIQLIAKAGISVISDIDDTIKITEVLDKYSLIKNTFTRPFKPVPGMAKFYNTLAQQQNITFHYVSNSPWQLYQSLMDFLIDNTFPFGSFHLRLFRWKDSSFFKFFQTSSDHKVKTIQSLIECCPGRRFILIGDSGQQDPEIYTSIARQYTQQIIHIFIRDVTGEKRESQRYQKTFKGLPDSLWTVFQEAATLKW